MDCVVITRDCVSGMYEICTICSYKSKTHFVQVWVESQFRQQSCEPLLGGVSACVDHVANAFATFSEMDGSERGGQKLCLSFGSISYCRPLAEYVFY